jgi:hypothetical protein
MDRRGLAVSIIVILVVLALGVLYAGTNLDSDKIREGEVYLGGEPYQYPGSCEDYPLGPGCECAFKISNNYLNTGMLDTPKAKTDFAYSLSGSTNCIPVTHQVK